ncbi:hypothetical protein MTO96_033747 [Rhipicephalus appendiculatus]
MFTTTTGVVDVYLRTVANRYSTGSFRYGVVGGALELVLHARVERNGCFTLCAQRETTVGKTRDETEKVCGFHWMAFFVARLCGAEDYSDEARWASKLKALQCESYLQLACGRR